MYKKKLNIFVLILLSSYSFYNPMGLINPTVSKFIFYLICLYALYVAVKYGKVLKNLKYPRTSYLLIFSGFITSIANAQLFHNQNVVTSFIAILPYLFAYLIFYILLKFDIPKYSIIKVIFVFCFISMFAYVVNLLTLPNKFFGGAMDEIDVSRGFARIGVYSIELIVFMLFYSINQWTINRKKSYLCLIILSVIYVFLSLTRQIIFWSLIIGLVLYIKKLPVYKKILVIIVSVLVYEVVLPQIPIYNSMVELSKSQAEDNNDGNENVRITAWRFYTYEYQMNVFTEIFGNGVPSIGNSEWGNEFERTVYLEYGGNGCYTSDVGWAGFYWNYGLFATIGLICLLFRAIFCKKQKGDEYLSYWCAFIFLTSITSGPIVISKQIVSIMVILYLIFKSKINVKCKKYYICQ